ncbi:glycosyltransferase family 4 protein [Gammaproteobacteria bacterium]|nr:glycosyltransferase family 4 protein [Gammaproteobacteria bacterium]
MRIALLPDEYLPSGTRVHSRMFHELALQLKKVGHHPIVITPGTPLQKLSLEIDFVDGIEVWRFKSGYTRGVGMVRRAINEWLISFRAWHAIKNKVKENNFDLCINYAPTIFFGPLAKKFKSRGTYIYLILRDMFPQWIIDQGLIKEKSLAAIFFRYYEKLNYQVADCIGIQSKANLDLFNEKFPNFAEIKILRNWSSTEALPSKNYNIDLLNQIGLANKIVFFYGGNTGYAQDMTNIMRLARNLKSLEEAHFLIIGQGDEFNLILDLKLKWDLFNVTIMPSIPQNEFSRVLATIDVGLFSLSSQHSTHNFPGKLLGYMLESKPILGSVNIGNDLFETINTSGAGLAFVNGDDDLLADAAIKMTLDNNLRTTMGLRARNLLLSEFSVESAVDSILIAMKARS